MLNKIIKDNSFVISFGFVADLFNVFLLKNNVSISSVRGNLSMNYYYDYKLFGKIFAFLHYKVIKHSNYIFSMTSSMSRKIKKVTGRDSTIVKNFIDEISLKNFKVNNISKNDTLQFIFIGTLSDRKNIMFLLNSFHELLVTNPNISLNILGNGPLYKKVDAYIKNNKIEKKVNLIVYKNNPYAFIKNSDIFVLPSYSEGISRAAIEALYFNLPCIMFKVDGNEELIKENFNGYLCTDDKNFNSIMQKAIDNIEKLKKNKMLPEEFKQDVVSKIIKNFIYEK